MGLLSGIFGSGIVGTVEEIAKEWIDTDLEEAEAKTLMIKTLDPNGLMRREISRKVSSMYVLYLLVTMVLVIAYSFGYGDKDSISEAIDSLTSLFLPITGMFTAIVGASFGVNGLNTKQGK